MNKIFIFLFLNIFHILLYSQNHDDYFSKYSIHLSDSTSKSGLIDYDFNRFNGFFIGEDHNIKCIADKDIIISIQ